MGRFEGLKLCNNPDRFFDASVRDTTVVAVKPPSVPDGLRFTASIRGWWLALIHLK